LVRGLKRTGKGQSANWKNLHSGKRGGVEPGGIDRGDRAEGE